MARRDHEAKLRRVYGLIESGLTPAQAARKCGVSRTWINYHVCRSREHRATAWIADRWDALTSRPCDYCSRPFAWWSEGHSYRDIADKPPETYYFCSELCTIAHIQQSRIAR